jgi:hypothetical protein
MMQLKINAALKFFFDSMRTGATLNFQAKQTNAKQQWRQHYAACLELP